MACEEGITANFMYMLLILFSKKIDSYCVFIVNLNLYSNGWPNSFWYPRLFKILTRNGPSFRAIVVDRCILPYIQGHCKRIWGIYR